MRVGIITKIGKNYGAVLQAYALKKKLCNMGADAHVIKYTPINSQKSYKVLRYPWRFAGTVENIKAALHFADHNKCSKKFYDFRNEFYDFIGEYCNDEEIEKDPPQCDIYITGSDQVWNPQISFDRAFYCMFAKKYPDSKIASYAASIGLSKIPDEFVGEFQSRIKQFDYISVRENQAINILEQMGIPAKIAPDPTLLLSSQEWQSISVKPIEEPYILCYFVSFPRGIENVVAQIKGKFGYKVINLMTSEDSSKIGDVKIRNAGPREFLGLFENASFVITSSFHGTVFSLINRKPFVVTLYKSTSSRVTQLLETYNLTNRIITSDCNNISSYCNTDIYSNEYEEMIKDTRVTGTRILEEIMGDYNDF